MGMEAGTEILKHRANPPKKNSRRSWVEKHQKWNRDIFKLAGKHEGFHPCFVNKEAVDDYRDKGYIIAKASDWGEKSKGTKRTGMTPGSGLQRRGMVLMEIPLSEHDEMVMAQRMVTAMRTDNAAVENVLKSQNNTELAESMDLQDLSDKEF